jgi:Ca2+/Na+ antiporter
MDEMVQILKYFYKELLILLVLGYILYRYLSRKSKPEKHTVEEITEEKYTAEIDDDIPKEKIIGIIIAVIAIIILVVAMYYLVPMLLDSILPKDN